MSNERGVAKDRRVFNSWHDETFLSIEPFCSRLATLDLDGSPKEGDETQQIEVVKSLDEISALFLELHGRHSIPRWFDHALIGVPGWGHHAILTVEEKRLFVTFWFYYRTVDNRPRALQVLNQHRADKGGRPIDIMEPTQPKLNREGIERRTQTMKMIKMKKTKQTTQPDTVTSETLPEVPQTTHLANGDPSLDIPEEQSSAPTVLEKKRKRKSCKKGDDHLSMPSKRQRTPEAVPYCVPATIPVISQGRSKSDFIDKRARHDQDKSSIALSRPPRVATVYKSKRSSNEDSASTTRQKGAKRASRKAHIHAADVADTAVVTPGPLQPSSSVPESEAPKPKRSRQKVKHALPCQGPAVKLEATETVLGVVGDRLARRKRVRILNEVPTTANPPPQGHVPPLCTDSTQPEQNADIQEEYQQPRSPPNIPTNHPEPPNPYPIIHSPCNGSDIDTQPHTVPEVANLKVEPVAQPLPCAATSNTHQHRTQPTYVPSLPRKQPLPGFPPIWAQSRQEVCESFEWFRSYQGGVYHSQGLVYGYLLSAFASQRDCFSHDGRLIISHGGGKAESVHSTKGQHTVHAASDQMAGDKSVRALINNYRTGQPLALIIDNKYSPFPFDLDSKEVTYAVLGFYTVAHYWAEYENADNTAGRVVRYKFAFRWCEVQGSPWWLEWVPGSLVMRPERPPPQPFGFTADRFPSPPPSCTLQDPPHTIPFSEAADSDEELPTHFLMNEDPDPILTFPGLIYNRCRACGRPSPQVFSHSWTCLMPDCQRFWKDSRSGTYLPAELIYHEGFLTLPPSKALPESFRDLEPRPPKSNPQDGIVTSYAYTRGWHCKQCGRLSSRYQWEKWECMNCHATQWVQGRIHEAKEFWCRDVLSNQRNTLIAPTSGITFDPPRYYSHGQGLGSVQTFFFPGNRGKIHHIQSGTPLGKLEADNIFRLYQEQAAAGTLRFRRWPLRAHKCRGPLLTHYFSQNSGEPYQYVGGAANTVPFSEAPGAVILARDFIQKRINQALERNVEFNEVLSAAYMEKQSMAFHSDNEVGLGPYEVNTEEPQRRIVATFVLRHGDVLVMDGGEVQEFYEHTVVPNNFRIAATARQIAPHHR